MQYQTVNLSRLWLENLAHAATFVAGRAALTPVWVLSVPNVGAWGTSLVGGEARV